MKEYQCSQEKIKFRHEQEIKNIEFKARKKRQSVMELNLKLRADEEILTDKDQIYDNFDKIYQRNPQNTLLLCKKLLRKPTKKELENTRVIEEELLEVVRKKKTLEEKGIAIIVLGLKYAIETSENILTFSRYSNAKTQLSAKILTSGFLENTYMFREHLEDTPKWNFDALYGNNEKIMEFIEEYKTKKAEQFGIKREGIVVIRLVEGCTEP